MDTPITFLLTSLVMLFSFARGISFTSRTKADEFIISRVVANSRCADRYITVKIYTVFNISSFSNIEMVFSLQVSWAEIIERGRKITQRVPLNGIVWYPGGSMKKSRFWHNVCVLLFHMIPAYIIDILLFLLGYKPM